MVMKFLEKDYIEDGKPDRQCHPVKAGGNVAPLKVEGGGRGKPAVTEADEEFAESRLIQMEGAGSVEKARQCAKNAQRERERSRSQGELKKEADQERRHDGSDTDPQGGDAIGKEAVRHRTGRDGKASLEDKPGPFIFSVAKVQAGMIA